MAGTGPSDGFLSSYFSNPFKKKKKRGEDIELPMPPGGTRDPRLPKRSALDEIKEGYKTFKHLGKKRKD